MSLLSWFFNVRTVRALICIRSECCPMPSCAVPCRLCYQMCTRAYPFTCTCRCTLRCAGADWRPAGQGGGGWRHSRQGLLRTINERHQSHERHWRRRIEGGLQVQSATLHENFACGAGRPAFTSRRPPEYDWPDEWALHKRELCECSDLQSPDFPPVAQGAPGFYKAAGRREWQETKPGCT